jgi:VWFA-related protein
MRVSAVLASMFATALTAGAQQPAKQPPPVVERVEVSRIIVDARVIDDAGSAVGGLSAADFHVLIGGRPALVQMAVWTGDSTANADVGEPRPLSRAGSTETDDPGQLVVLLFQKSLENGRARGLIRLVEQSRDLVRSLPAADRVAIVQFQNSLSIYSDFTADREALDRILAHDLLHQPTPKSVARGSPSLLDVLTPARRRKVTTMEMAFSAVADAVRSMPGSKAIAYIGYGMGLPPFGVRADGGAMRARFGSMPEDLSHLADMNNEYGRAVRALNDGRVSVFSLDISNADIHSLAAGMQVIAADTGGFYAHSLDFPEKPMKFVSGALSGHYVLYVEPPPQSTEHTIAVSVTTDRPTYVYATSSYKSVVR